MGWIKGSITNQTTASHTETAGMKTILHDVMMQIEQPN